MYLSQEGFFPYARLLFEGYQAMRSTKSRMLNRGVKKDLVAADPEAYKIDEEVSRHCPSADILRGIHDRSCLSRIYRNRPRISPLALTLLGCLRVCVFSQLMWWSFSSTTTNISALSNPMFLGTVSDARTTLCLSLGVAVCALYPSSSLGSLPPPVSSLLRSTLLTVCTAGWRPYYLPDLDHPWR